MNIPIISSDCKNGPTEFLDNGIGGVLYKSNNEKSLLDSFSKFESLGLDQINKFRINSNFKLLKNRKKVIIGPK